MDKEKEGTAYGADNHRLIDLRIKDSLSTERVYKGTETLLLCEQNQKQPSKAVNIPLVEKARQLESVNRKKFRRFT